MSQILQPSPTLRPTACRPPPSRSSTARSLAVRLPAAVGRPGSCTAPGPRGGARPRRPCMSDPPRRRRTRRGAAAAAAAGRRRSTAASTDRRDRARDGGRVARRRRRRRRAGTWTGCTWLPARDHRDGHPGIVRALRRDHRGEARASPGTSSAAATARSPPPPRAGGEPGPASYVPQGHNRPIVIKSSRPKGSSPQATRRTLRRRAACRSGVRRVAARRRHPRRRRRRRRARATTAPPPQGYRTHKRRRRPPERPAPATSAVPGRACGLRHAAAAVNRSCTIDWARPPPKSARGTRFCCDL